MSFGVGFGDVYTLCKLVNRTHSGWKDACGVHSHFTNDLAILESVVSRVEAAVSRPDSNVLKSPEDAEGWKIVSDRCSSVVTELEGVLANYESLGKSQRRNWSGIRQNWDRLRFGNKNWEDLHKQLTKATAGLTAYVSVIGLDSQLRIEHSIFPQILERMDTMAAQLRKGNSTIRSTLTIHTDDDTEVWREWRRDLIRSGIRSTDIHRYSAALKTHLLHLKRDGMLDEDEPPPLPDATSAQRAASEPSVSKPDALTHDEAGRTMYTIVEETSRAWTDQPRGSPQSPAHNTNYRSPFVEDAFEDESEDQPRADYVDQQEVTDDVDLKFNDTLASTQSTDKVLGDNDSPAPAKTVAASRPDLTTGTSDDFDQGVEHHVVASDMIPAAQHNSTTHSERKSTNITSEQGFQGRRTRSVVNRRMKRVDTTELPQSFGDAPSQGIATEQSNNNEPDNMEKPSVVKRRLRTMLRVPPKKVEAKDPTPKPRTTPGSKKAARETVQLRDATESRGQRTSRTPYTFVPPPPTGNTQPNTENLDARTTGAQVDAPGLKRSSPVGNALPHRQKSTGLDDIWGSPFPPPNHGTSDGPKRQMGENITSGPRSSNRNGGMPMPPPPPPPNIPPALKSDAPPKNAPRQKSLNAEDIFAQFFSPSGANSQDSNNATAGVKSPTGQRPPDKTGAVPPPPFVPPTNPSASAWNPSPKTAPQPAAVPSASKTTGPRAITWHQLRREELHPSLNKAMVLPEGWDYRLDGQNRVFYVDTYARCSEKHCFWRPPVREQPDLVSRGLGWRKVYNVFGRVHWVHDESKVVSYTRPDKIKGFHCVSGSFAVWDADERRYRMWYHLIAEGKKIVVDDSNTACQIKAEVWDRGISDEAVEVRGDLWWGAADVKESNLRLTRQDASTYTINPTSSKEALR